ncbi:MAG: hypothetical protein NTW96_25360 [Planctomycetia bacterium]|nr:hypothetical protein [Planctomycetia bacterium]
MPWEADDALVEVSDTHTEAKLQPGVPIDDDVMPWEADDALVEVSDTHTEAKLQPGFLFDARPEYR